VFYTSVKIFMKPSNFIGALVTK